MKKMQLKSWTSVVLVCVSTAIARADESAQEILKATGVGGELIVHIGCDEGELTAGLQAHDGLVVHGLDTEETNVLEARTQIAAKGRYGAVSVATWDGDRLPYTDNLVNVIVCSDPQAPAEEIARVLAPRGVACVRKGSTLELPGFETQATRNWVLYRKPVPPEIDDWTHHCHGPDGNPVAEDEVVGPPQGFQWIQEPRWMRSHDSDSSVSCMVTANGRIIYMEDWAPISLSGDNDVPDNWHLTARDAFNGILLWKIPVNEWGWRQWKDTWHASRGENTPVNIHRRVVAAGDKVYATLGFNAPVSQLDAATGKVLQAYEGTDGTREIIFHDGQLILTVPRQEYLKVMVFDASTAELQWQTDPIYGGTARESSSISSSLQPVLNAAVDDDAVCFMNRADIVCLDRGTGKPAWTRTVLPAVDVSAGKKKAEPDNTLWVGTLIVSDGVVVYSEPGRVSAFAIPDGEELWSQDTVPRYSGLWFTWKDVFVIDGQLWTWMGAKPKDEKGRRFEPLVAQSFDLQTGEKIQAVPTGNIYNVHHHHRCYRNKATSRYILSSRRGTEFVDLKDGEHVVNVWVRGTCHLGMMPANGLQYATPHPCKCYSYDHLNGLLALSSSASDAVGDDVQRNKPRLVTGKAYGKISGPDASPQEWSAFRADSERSCSTETAIPSRNVTRIWKNELGHKLSAPTVADNRVYLSAVDAHTVYALDSDSGKEVWSFIADGRIDTPPTYYKGMLLFGTRSGYAYCLRASDGALSWRFRAAPHERLIGAFDGIESAWPVYGAVLVKDGIAYLAAGRSSHLDGGIRVFGLDPATGKILHQTVEYGPETDISDPEWHNVDGEGSRNDVLQAAGDYIYMRHASFDKQLGRGEETDRIHIKGGFLDDTYFQRVFCAYGSYADTFYNQFIIPKENRRSDSSTFYNGKALSQILINDEKTLYGTRMFDHMKLLNAWNYFTPADKGYIVFAVDRETRDTLWSGRVPIRVKAMAASSTSLAVAGAPDLLDANDPLGAFEGRKGGRLRILSAGTGEELAELELDSPPVLNGIAAATDRLFLSLQDGSIVSIGATTKE
ncbi:MAG: PQQ-binding-like beta-propeller repeat protein [Bythopirellula sp.]